MPPKKGRSRTPAVRRAPSARTRAAVEEAEKILSKTPTTAELPPKTLRRVSTTPMSAQRNPTKEVEGAVSSHAVPTLVQETNKAQTNNVVEESNKEILCSNTSFMTQRAGTVVLTCFVTYFIVVCYLLLTNVIFKGVGVL